MRALTPLLILAAVDAAELSRVAILVSGEALHGDSGRKGGNDDTARGRGWACAAAESFRSNLVEPLERTGRDVDVFVATAAKGGCDAWFESWRAALGPRLRAYAVSHVSRSRSVAFRRSVDLAIRWNVNRRPVHYACDVTDDAPPATSAFRAQILAQTYATVIVARPDAVWRDPRYAASLVATDDVVYTHRCEAGVWRRWQCVSDVVIAMPARVFAESLKPCAWAWFDPGVYRVTPSPRPLVLRRFNEAHRMRAETPPAQGGFRNFPRRPNAHHVYRCLNSTFPSLRAAFTLPDTQYVNTREHWVEGLPFALGRTIFFEPLPPLATCPAEPWEVRLRPDPKVPTRPARRPPRRRVRRPRKREG